ncbi:MAG: hypothetical protein AAB438_03315 [Patescibacteria group bacterium]
MKKYLGFLAIVAFAFFSQNAFAQTSTTTTSSTSATTTGTINCIKAPCTTANPGLPGADSMVRDARPIDDTNQGAPEEKSQVEMLRAQAQTKMDALKAAIKLERNALTKRLKEERLLGRENALKRFDKAVERVELYQARVDVQIGKVEALNIDVTLAKTNAAIAAEKLNQAKTKIVEIHNMLTASANEITGVTKTNLKTKTKETETLIKDAYQALNDAIKTLKDSVKAKRDTAVSAGANASVNTTTTTNQ